MNPSDLQARLIAVARKTPPQDRVPYAFEKRVMARLAALAPINPWAMWGRSLWRAAFACIAITFICGVWSFAAAPPGGNDESFSQSFQSAVYAPISQHVGDVW